MRLTFAAFPMTFVAAIACSRDQPSSGSPAAGPSGSASAAATASAPNDGIDPKAPVLSPDDATFVDARKGAGWGDRCFNEIKQGKLGWARAACDRGLALPELGAASRPPLLYNEGLIAKKSGDLASARSYFTQSLALRPAGDPGRPIVEKELLSIGGTVPPPAAAVVGSLECRAHGGGQTTELYLDWQQNTAKGSLRVITAAGGVTTKPVQAELYKGLVLVDPAGSPPPVTGKVATVQTDPKKTLQLGDYKQPWWPCD